MAFITNYYATGANGVHLDLLTAAPSKGGPGIPVKVIGTAGRDYVFAAAGSNVDASELGTGGDVLYLTGKLATYDRSTDDFNIHTLRRTDGLDAGQQEIALTRSQPEHDVVYFRDGYVDTDANGEGFAKLNPIGAQDPHTGALWNPEIDLEPLKVSLKPDEFINAVITDDNHGVAFIMSYLSNQVTVASISANALTTIHRFTVTHEADAENLSASIDTSMQTVSLSDPVTLKYGMENFAFPYAEFDTIKHAINSFYGTAGNDQIAGSNANELFYGAQGNDELDGGAGNDAAVYAGKRSDFNVHKESGGFHIDDQAGSAGSDALKNIESIRFDDSSINLLIGEHAKGLAPDSLKMLQELYVAFFNRIPEADGLDYWISKFMAGSSIDAIAESFYSAAVGHTDLTGYSAATSHVDFIKTIYKNVLGRSGDTAPTVEEYEYWAGELINGHATRGSVVKDMLASAHTFKGDAAWGWVLDLLDNKNLVTHYFAVQNGLNYPTPDDSITKGISIAAAVTSTDTSAAIALIGVDDAGFSLT